MKIHCDACGAELRSEEAFRREWDGETFCFCSEACARAGRHLATDVQPGELEAGFGPRAQGDLDERSR
jgi:hypothetical protein